MPVLHLKKNDATPSSRALCRLIQYAPVAYVEV